MQVNDSFFGKFSDYVKDGNISAEEFTELKSTYLQEFKCMTQYNETSFEFLKRLAKRYGQWFYFDGMRMQFGQIKTSKVKLINKASLHEFGIETNLVSHKTSFAGYDHNNATNIRNSEATTAMGSKDSFSKLIRGVQDL